MDAREFLEQPKKIDLMIANKLVEIEQWKLIATSTTTHQENERVQTSGSKQKMADATDKFVDIEEEVKKCMNDLIEKKNDVISVIEQLKAKEYDVVHKMYIGVLEEVMVFGEKRKVTVYKTLDEVAWMNGKSRSWAKGKHKSALANVQRILDEREKA